MLDERAANARSSNPFEAIGDKTVSVQVISVVRASNSSFQVKCSERAYERGSLAGTSRWTAIVTVMVKPPGDAETLRKNPLGLHVEAIDWSREFDTPIDRPSVAPVQPVPPQPAHRIPPRSRSERIPATQKVRMAGHRVWHSNLLLGRSGRHR